MKTNCLTNPMKMACIISLIILLIASTSFGQITRIQTFSESDLATTETIIKDGNEYCRIAYKDLQTTEEVGKPELPLKYVQLLIPSSETVESITLKSKNMKQITLEKKIYPFQPLLPTSDDYIEWEFCQPNEDIYNSEEPYPQENVRLVDEGYFDGNHIITLAVYPVIYYPILNYFEFYSTLEFEITLTPMDRIKKTVKNRTEKNQKIYDISLKGLVLS